MTQASAIASRVLPLIVLSQLFATSLWFAGNAVVRELAPTLGSGAGAMAWLISSVQLGFIGGTFLFAFLNLSDRFPGPALFFSSALVGAVANLGVYFFSDSMAGIIGCRLITGIALAGIYPVGMKIAAGWYDKNLGHAIGWLVGALVAGSGLPFLLRAAGGVPWQMVIPLTSGAAVIGGALMFVLVPEGPHLKGRARFEPRALIAAFREEGFRRSAFGYFGHMWELYAFWAFLPGFLLSADSGATAETISFRVFLVFLSGGLGCVLGGLLSRSWGSARVARTALIGSAACCFASGGFSYLPQWGFLPVVLLWGFLVVADSPQFSALNAARAPRAYVGSALTIVNCLGFAITIVSIELLGWLHRTWPIGSLYWILGLGPVLGLAALGAKRSANLAGGRL